MESAAARIGRINPFYVMALLARARELEQAGRDIVHMEIGEPDFPTPRPIVDAGMEALRLGDVKYTPALGLPELRQAIADHYRTRYGVAVDSQRVIVTPGASGALLLALGVLVNSGDAFLLADPGYPCNRNFVALFDGEPVLMPVTADSAFQPDVGSIERHWTGQTRGVLVASPSNPTGTCIAPDELGAIARWTEDAGGVLVSDEIYHGLEYEGRSKTALEASDSAFVINSFSKYFGMTGWRVGWLVVPERWVGAVEKLAQNIFIAAPTHSQRAALAAFDEATRQVVEARRREFWQRRDYLYGELLRLGFTVPVKPEGAFYIYTDCSRFSSRSDRFASDLLERAGVAVTPGKDFGVNGASRFLRFAYTTAIERLAEGVRRIERFL